MHVKAVLFDLFDTLLLIRRTDDFYTPALKRMHQFLSQNGVKVPFDVFEQTYIQTRDELYAQTEANLEEPHFDVRVSLTLKRLGYNYEVSNSLVKAATGEFCDEFMKFVSIDKDARIVLQELSRKYRLGVISNFAVPECVDKLMKLQGLEGWFEVILVSGAVNRRKPSQDIFKQGIQTMGVAAGDVVFVGDTLEADIDGAKSVGLRAVYIQRRLEKTEGHREPDVTIKSLTELPRVLEDLTKKINGI
jgi:putative hydrolase of the HAD superfamily